MIIYLLYTSTQYMLVLKNFGNKSKTSVVFLKVSLFSLWNRKAPTLIWFLKLLLSIIWPKIPGSQQHKTMLINSDKNVCTPRVYTAVVLCILQWHWTSLTMETSLLKRGVWYDKYHHCEECDITWLALAGLIPVLYMGVIT